jgi:hypothetical protein
MFVAELHVRASVQTMHVATSACRALGGQVHNIQEVHF